MHYDIVSIIASARGVTPLKALLSQMPANFQSPIVCMVEGHASLVAELESATRLKVKWATAGETLLPGHVYLSPPGSSLVASDGASLSVLPFGAESSALHPIDSFLFTVGRHYGRRALAIVLSGFPNDGADGAASFTQTGGCLLVLDRATARHWGVAEPMIQAAGNSRTLVLQEVVEALRACFNSQSLLKCVEIQVELGALLEHALKHGRTRMGAIQALDRVNNKLRVVAQRGLCVDFFEQFGSLPIEAELPFTAAFREKRRVTVADVYEQHASEPERAIASACGYRGLQATPIESPPHVAQGVLSTFYPMRHLVAQAEARALDDAARHAAQIVMRLDA